MAQDCSSRVSQIPDQYSIKMKSKVQRIAIDFNSSSSTLFIRFYAAHVRKGIKGSGCLTVSLRHHSNDHTLAAYPHKVLVIQNQKVAGRIRRIRTRVLPKKQWVFSSPWSSLCVAPRPFYPRSFCP